MDPTVVVPEGLVTLAHVSPELAAGVEFVVEPQVEGNYSGPTGLDNGVSLSA